jgi:soluble lytic murein transglycosylase-like protein
LTARGVFLEFAMRGRPATLPINRHLLAIKGTAMKAPLNKAQLVRSLQTSVLDVREGFLEITRHGLALLGLAVVLVSVAFLARPQLQSEASEVLLSWLQIRQIDTQEAPEPSNAALRATTQDLKTLTPDQLSVTRWLSRKYRIGPEPLAAVVTEAWTLGDKTQLSPTLILAIMAIESRFNPFTAGSQGAVGLMQIEVNAHADTLAQHGGNFAAFDALTNVRIGVRHLQALLQQTNSLEDALALYGEASGQSSDSQYADRVLAEQQQLDAQITAKTATTTSTASTNAK